MSSRAVRTPASTSYLRWLAALGVLCLVVASTQVGAIGPNRAGSPDLLRLEGYVTNAPAGIKPEAHLVLQYQGKDYEFDLSKMVVVTGSRTYGQVLQEITPYRVSFLLRGPSPAVGKLTGAAPGQKLIVLGRHRAGSRDLQLVDVSEAPPDATPTVP
ncbi:MAG: hypothetical protein HYR72_02210 [Deltaproteobacteria bacterium]|nr:hypothetical protein [Deltaproteobacteria bacterium]MBI3387482.1 hypothetical protein [Deltaproteobacteria bacterium]